MVAAKRTFTNVDAPGSTYVSATPSGAAGKAYSIATRGMKEKPTSQIITLKLKSEVDNENAKVWKYNVVRIPLKTVKKIPLGNKIVEKTYETKVVSMNKKPTEKKKTEKKTIEKKTTEKKTTEKKTTEKKTTEKKKTEKK
jgi:hypothetical protein